MVLGFDFGTTYSEPVAIKMGNPVLLLPPNVAAIPSAFYYDKQRGELVGEAAEDAGVGIKAENLILDVKMKTKQSFVIDGKTFSAEDIIASIISYGVEKAKSIAEDNNMDRNIGEIVLTVPAKFGLAEKETIRKAAERKVKVCALVAEPVAAALAYFKDTLENNTTVMVYDLGGGTCDIAIVRANNQRRERFEVVGDPRMIRIGGRNWDQRIGDYILEQVIEQSGKSEIAADKGYLEDIRRAAKKAKERLTELSKHTVVITIDRIPYKVEITRDQMNRRTQSLLKETLDCMQELYDENKSKYNISKIICVGGSSNMPQVKEEIEKRFPQCQVQRWQPSIAIAYGAAIYSTLDEPPITKAPFSYGIKCYDDYDKDTEKIIVVNLIKKGETLPASGEHRFSTVRANLRTTGFPVYESENSLDEYAPNHGKQIGRLEMKLAPNTPKDYSFRVRMRLNEHGLLEVEASDRKRNKVETTINITSG